MPIMNFVYFLLKIILSFFLLFSSALCQENSSMTLKLYNINNVSYINIGEFVFKNNIESQYYNSKEKLEIIYKNKKIYFSPSSSFCKVNKKVYHLIHPSIYNNQELFKSSSSQPTI